MQVFAPAAPTVTPTGGAAGAYGYKVVVRLLSGSTLAPTDEGTTATGPATLDATHYNTVEWDAPTGTNAADLTYDVYRSSGGDTQGLIAAGQAARTLKDDGLVAAGAVPTTGATVAGAPFDALYVGSTGSVIVNTEKGVQQTFAGVPAGALLRVAGVAVDLTSTADDIVALRR